MASDVLGFGYVSTGKNLYVTVRNLDGEIWDTTGTPAFETYSTAALANYDIAMTEQGTASRFYVFTFPSGISAGTYVVTAYERAGASPTEGDLAVYQWIVYWDGDRLGGVEVAAIDESALAATNLKQSALAIKTGTVQTAAGDPNTATVFDTDLPQENSNYYGDGDGGIVIAFVEGADHPFQPRRLVASADSGSNTRITLEAALDGTPSDGDAFVVLGRITELG